MNDRRDRHYQDQLLLLVVPVYRNNNFKIGNGSKKIFTSDHSNREIYLTKEDRKKTRNVAVIETESSS